MSSPPTLDIAALLEPIPGANPSGMSLAYTGEYDAIREARRSDDQLNQGAWKREVKVADWDEVVDLAASCLKAKTKDIQIAAWLTEGLARIHSFAGLRDGLIVLREIQERFWETYFPEIEDGDVESRFAPFQFLNDKVRGLPMLVRTLPVTEGLDGQDYHTIQFAQSRETDNLIKKEPAREKQILAEGRLTVKQFDDAVAQTPKKFYALLAADIKEAVEALKLFEASTDERFGRDAPSLIELVKALDDCTRLVDPILAAKRLADPDPLPEVEPTPADEAGVESQETAENAPSSSPVNASSDGVAVPKRRSRLGTPQEGETLDYGRVLIEYRDRVQSLAEAGAKLSENRQKYAGLLDELKRLDDEYEELSQVVSRNREAYSLLARLLKLP